MSNMHIDSVLAQIRSMSSQVQGSGKSPIAGIANQLSSNGVNKSGGVQGDFASIMKQGIDQVNQSQVRASDMATAFERGTPGVELSDVMLEMQKANVSFRALAEVRNRFVSVYQEVMNMQI
jgi:flagellar hook-basal body complex protein FliE